MLYQFKSKVTGNVIMLQPNGEQVLQIIGKHSKLDPSTKGILLPEQMPHALAALEAAIASEDAARAEAVAQAKVDHVPPANADAIGLHQRALPLMEMIRECHKANEVITWGV
jgi:hypothetical protein